MVGSLRHRGCVRGRSGDSPSRVNLHEATIPEEAAAGEAHSLPLASLAPLKLVTPLLTPTIISPSAAYALVKTRAASLHITEAFQPLLAWLMIGIKEAAPCLDTLGALDLEDQVTGIQKNMWRGLAPVPPPAAPNAPNSIMQAAPVQVLYDTEVV